MKNNYRKIFKWGDPAHEEALDPHMKDFLKESFSLTDKDLLKKYLPGDKTVKLKKKCGLSAVAVKSLQKIVGNENVSIDDFDRASHSAAKFYLELLMTRMGTIKHPPDAVVYPRNEDEIIAVMKLCNARKIPLIPFGGHSSVTRGVEAVRGGISLDLTRHMKSVVRVNEVNQSITVQPGIYGPDLESYLNNYKIGYTCGHFPQSFEYSTVGGWVATRSAGQASTGYGKIEDMVLSLRMVSPRGLVATKDYPAAALGPDIDQIIIGSEGTFGIITEVTLKIRKFHPTSTKHCSFLFKDFTSAVRTMREVMQGEFGFPHLFRISDPEETDVAFKLKNKKGTLADKVLSMMGYLPMRRCLMFVSIEGDAASNRLVKRKISDSARKNGALPTGSAPTQKWLEQRYSSAYLRDPLMDAGIMTDTLETAVSWEKIIPLWDAVRSYIKSRPKTVCMVHISHAYENGANLYFVFLSPMKKNNNAEDFTTYHRGIIDTIHKNGGSLSHHHGIGRMLGPWMKDEIGDTGHDLLLALKDYFDPKGVINPGGVLGLKR